MENLHIEKPVKGQRVLVNLPKPPKDFPNLPISEEAAKKLRVIALWEKTSGHFIVRR